MVPLHSDGRHGRLCSKLPASSRWCRCTPPCWIRHRLTTSIVGQNAAATMHHRCGRHCSRYRYPLGRRVHGDPFWASQVIVTSQFFSFQKYFFCRLGPRNFLLIFLELIKLNREFFKVNQFNMNNSNFSWNFLSSFGIYFVSFKFLVFS